MPLPGVNSAQSRVLLLFTKALFAYLATHPIEPER